MAKLNRVPVELLGWLRRRLPELLVLLVCMVVLGAGVSRKEGFHMDELLSFELANAEFNPWIVPTQPQGRLAKFVNNEIKGETLSETAQNLWNTARDVLQNRGNSKLLSYKADVYQEPVWIERTQFEDYITVDEGDAFNYLSVYFNVKDDNHPPLHFMLLHTISSIFKGRAEAWMGCGINMVCVAVSMILLMKLGQLLAPAIGMPGRGRALGLSAALLYGLSQGAMATTLLIRMYGVVSCLSVALLYFHVKKWLESGFEKKNKALIVVTILGFWTQYFFLFYCLILAVVTAVLLWCRKRGRELFCYVRAMIIAAVIGICGFPFAISDVFASERGVEALDNLSSGLAGYGSRLWSFGRILVNRTFGQLLWIVLLLLGVAIIITFIKKKTVLNMSGALMSMLVLPCVGYFLLASRMSPYLVDRYIMPLFPLVMLVGTVFASGAVGYLEQVWGKRGRAGRVLYMLLAAALFLQGSALGYDGEYLYPDYEEQEAIAGEYSSLPCICVYEGVGYYENLPEFTYYDRTLLVKPGELKERQDVASVASLKEAVLLLKGYVDKTEIFEVLEQRYGLESSSELYTNPETGDGLYLLRTAEE